MRTKRIKPQPFSIFIILVLIITTIFCLSSYAAEDQMKFLSSVKDDKGNRITDTSQYVPFLPGDASFGWIMQVTDGSVKKVTITIIAPKKTSSWTKGTKVSSDGRTGILTKSLKAKDNFIYSGFTITKDDPLGRYSMTVKVGNISRTFDFEVVTVNMAVKKTIQELHNRRQHIDGFQKACMERGWGWEYQSELISREDFLLKADQIIANHEQRAIHYQICFKRMQSMNKSFTTTIDKLNNVLIKRINDEDTSKLEEAMKLMKKAVERMANNTNTVYPRIIQLELAEANHIRQLKRDVSRDPNVIIAQSPELAIAEHDIMKILRKDATSYVEEVEIAHALFPSVKSSARLANAKILGAFYVAIEKSDQQDNRTDLRKIKELRQDLKLVSFMVYQAANNPETIEAVPIIKSKYITILESLKKIDDSFADIESLNNEELDITKLSQQDAQRVIEYVKNILSEIDTNGKLIEEEIMLIDGLLR